MTNWQIGIGREEVFLPGGGDPVTVAHALAVVQATKRGLLVRALELVERKNLERRGTHLVMDCGARSASVPTVRGPFKMVNFWNAPYRRYKPTDGDLERLRELLESGAVRPANEGSEKLGRTVGFVAPALPSEPPIRLFLTVRSAILDGGDGGGLGLALMAAAHDLELLQEPEEEEAPPDGVFTTGPRRPRPSDGPSGPAPDEAFTTP